MLSPKFGHRFFGLAEDRYRSKALNLVGRVPTLARHKAAVTRSKQLILLPQPLIEQEPFWRTNSHLLEVWVLRVE